MSDLRLRLPESLHQAAREVAAREKVSLNQLITLALTEKLSALMTEEYLQARAAIGSRTSFEQALSKVPDAEPIAGDAY